MWKTYEGHHIKQKVRTRKQVLRNRAILRVISKVLFWLGLSSAFLAVGFNIEVPISTVLTVSLISVILLLTSASGFVILESTKEKY